MEDFTFKNYKTFCKIANLKENDYKSLKEFKKFLVLKNAIVKSCN